MIFKRKPSSEQGGGDKRIHRRKKTFNLMKFEDVFRSDSVESGRDKTHQVANVLNISEGGLRFAHRMKLEPHAILNIVVNLAEQNEQIAIVGKVMWVRKRKDTGVYHYGVSYVEISSDGQKAVNKLVHASRSASVWFQPQLH